MAKTRKRRIFSPEVKDEAVRQVTQKGIPLKDVAAKLGIAPSQLSQWKKQILKDDPTREALAAENKELRKKLKRAEMEREILKKATAFFAKLKA